MKKLIAIFFVLASISIPANARTLLTPTTSDFYVSTSGNDANDCRIATPCLTIQRAVDNIKQNYDSNCLQPWIHISPGTYAGWQDYETQTGCQPHGGGPMVIAGTMGRLGSDCTDFNAVWVTSPSGVTPISYDGHAKATIICMTVYSPNAPGVYATNGAVLEVGLLNLAGGTYAVMADAGGTIVVTSTLNFTGDYVYGIMGNLGGFANVVPGITVNFNGRTFYGQFLFGANQGRVSFPIPGVNMTGSFNGQKCFASMLGMVTASGNANSLPGTVNCGANYGGQVY